MILPLLTLVSHLFILSHFHSFIINKYIITFIYVRVLIQLFIHSNCLQIAHPFIAKMVGQQVLI